MKDEMRKKILFVVNVDWFFLSHRLPVALAAQNEGFSIYVAAKETDKANEIRAMGFYFIPLQLSRGGVGLWSNIKTFKHLILILHSIKPDLVHLVSIKPVLLGSIASRLMRVKSIIAAFSGMGFVFTNTSKKSYFLKKIILCLFRYVLNTENLKIIVQNSDDFALLEENVQIKPVAICLIPGSGVNLKEFNISNKSTERPRVLMASRLLIDKGVVDFVEACSLLFDEFPNVSFVLVGDLDPDNPSSITKHDLQKWIDAGIIEYWGNRSDMSQILNLCSILVLPSYREGLPKILIEGAASGVAIVTTDVPGCRDAIVSGVTGLLVPPRDAKELSKAIAYLLKNENHCKEMGEAGRKLAERHFNVDNVVERHLELYRDMMN